MAACRFCLARAISSSVHGLKIELVGHRESSPAGLSRRVVEAPDPR